MKTVQKRKAVVQYRKGIGQPLALQDHRITDQLKIVKL